MAKSQKSYPSLLTVFEYTVATGEMAKQGDSEAMWKYGLHNMDPRYRDIMKDIVNLKDEEFPRQIDPDKAIKYIEKAAKKGNPIGMILMGKYEYVKPNKNKEANLYLRDKESGMQALKWYEKALKQGYGDACALIYDIKIKYPNFKHVLYDERRGAVEYLNKGVSMMSPLSCKYLGKYYLNEPVDYKKAFEMFSMVEKLGFYSPELTECYLDGLGCDRNYYIAIKRIEENFNVKHSDHTFIRARRLLSLYDEVPGQRYSEWIEMMKNPGNNTHRTEYFNEVDSTYFSKDLQLLKRGGSFYITNSNGNYLTHSFDDAKIQGDSIILSFEKYITSIGKDGIIRNPIPNQMLEDWMQEGISLTRRMLLEKWICSLDADGEYGVACILFNNKGALEEQSYKSVDIKYKNGRGINKKTGVSLSEGINNGYVNFYYSKALPYYERALELNPDFDLAKMNAQRVYAALKKKRDSDSSPFLLGLSSCLQLANNIVQLHTNNALFKTKDEQNINTTAKSTTKKGNKSNAIASAQNERVAQNTYHDYVTLLIDMNTFRDRYDDNQRKGIQRSMKQIREKYKFTKSEWEDWNGISK